TNTQCSLYVESLASRVARASQRGAASTRPSRSLASTSSAVLISVVLTSVVSSARAAAYTSALALVRVLMLMLVLASPSARLVKARTRTHTRPLASHTSMSSRSVPPTARTTDHPTLGVPLLHSTRSTENGTRAPSPPNSLHTRPSED